MERRIWKIEWCDALSVGIPEIDEGHKRFISLINEFNRCNVGRMAVSEVKKRFHDILDNIEKDFAKEERLLEGWQYMDLSEHTSKHGQIIKLLHDIKLKALSCYDWEWLESGLKIKEALI
ncbi:MAG: hemerythrin domain-containing protein, partial [Gallionella sp.]